jgi:molybdopterin molybdotransferase
MGFATMNGLLFHTRNSKLNTRQFLGLDEALTLLRSIVSPVDGLTEVVPLADATGRVLAETIIAPMDVPPFFASAMDGYAICGADPVFGGKPPYLLPVVGESRAGLPFGEVPRVNCAVRIFTGAVMPQRCDTVVIQEHVQRHGANIVLQARPSMQTNVRPPGHDIENGAPLAAAGLALGAFDLAWLTACGLTIARVRPRIRLALFSTGDELRSAGEVLHPGQIYDANRFVLQQLLRDAPVLVNDLGILPDDPQAIEATLRTAAAQHDVVMTSGGVSVGDADYVRDIVERLGRIEFWKIAIKPGKPLAYGRIGDCHFFGLPGNPVSTIVTFLMLVKPILATLAGAAADAPLKVAATLGCDVAHEPGRVEYQRGAYSIDTNGISVQPTSDQSSNRIGSFRGANCLIEVPRTSGNLARGASVSILPLKGLLG